MTDQDYIEQLKTRLTALEKEHEEKRRVLDEAEKKIADHPKMKELVAWTDDIKTKISDYQDQVSQQEKELASLFLLDGSHHPRFQHKTSNWKETSIRPEVLFQIDCNIGLRHLRNDDVGDFVDKLINKAHAEHPEIHKLRDNLEHLIKERDSLFYQKQTLHCQLFEPYRQIEHDSWLPSKEINELRYKLANPQKALVQEKRQSKRDEARNKIHDQTIIDAVYNRLRELSAKTTQAGEEQ